MKNMLRGRNTLAIQNTEQGRNTEQMVGSRNRARIYSGGRLEHRVGVECRTGSEHRTQRGCGNVNTSGIQVSVRIQTTSMRGGKENWVENMEGTTSRTASIQSPLKA